MSDEVSAISETDIPKSSEVVLAEVDSFLKGQEVGSPRVMAMSDLLRHKRIENEIIVNDKNKHKTSLEQDYANATTSEFGALRNDVASREKLLPGYKDALKESGRIYNTLCTVLKREGKIMTNPNDAGNVDHRESIQYIKDEIDKRMDIGKSNAN